MLAKLGRDLVRLVRSWWRVDRVRISLDEGRLLRFEPPCIVVVEARPAEVLARTTGQSAAGPFVAYDCRSALGPCRLQVGLPGPGLAPRVCWTEQGAQRTIAADSVEVYPLRKARSPAHSALATRDAARYG